MADSDTSVSSLSYSSSSSSPGSSSSNLSGPLSSASSESTTFNSSSSSEIGVGYCVQVDARPSAHHDQLRLGVNGGLDVMEIEFLDSISVMASFDSFDRPTRFLHAWKRLYSVGILKGIRDFQAAGSATGAIGPLVMCVRGMHVFTGWHDADAKPVMNDLHVASMQTSGQTSIGTGQIGGEVEFRDFRLLFDCMGSLGPGVAYLSADCPCVETVMRSYAYFTFCYPEWAEEWSLTGTWAFNTDASGSYSVYVDDGTATLAIQQPDGVNDYLVRVQYSAVLALSATEWSVFFNNGSYFRIERYSSGGSVYIKGYFDIDPLTTTIVDISAVPQALWVTEIEVEVHSTGSVTARFTCTGVEYTMTDDYGGTLGDSQFCGMGGKNVEVTLFEIARLVSFSSAARSSLGRVMRAPKRKAMPSIYKQIGHAMRDAGAFVADGLATVNSEKRQERLAVCATCSELSDGRCAVCGCWVALKSWGRSWKCEKWPF